MSARAMQTAGVTACAQAGAGSSPARGFTLTELIVILSIVGILAWLAYPKMTAMDEIKLDAAARRLVADLRYAQSLAISKREVHGILFDPVMDRYTVFAPTPASPLTDPSDRGQALTVDYTSRAEFQGVQIVSAAFGATPGVKFDYFGVPRDTGMTDLGATGLVVLTYKGATDTVRVAPQTGVVDIR